MIAVTGATGHLGKLIIDQLIKNGTNPKEIVAIVRDRNKAQELEAKKIEIRVADYSSEESLQKAFTGIEKLMFVSGSEVGQRIPQHTNVVNAAKKARVKFIAYTSIPKADKNKMILAQEHLATEKMILASGIPYAMLRNSWYIENYTAQIKNYIASGVIAGSAKNGKISAATREDFAGAAAAVLMGRGAPNTIYELGGQAFTLEGLAAEISEITGKRVQYKDMPVAEFEKVLVGFHVPAEFAKVLADCDEGIVRGELFTGTEDLEKLLGRPPTSLSTAIKSVL